MTSPGWRKYKCPICKAQRVDREPKESQPPCKLCGHTLVCIDENYGRFMTAPCNLGLGAGAFIPYHLFKLLYRGDDMIETRRATLKIGGNTLQENAQRNMQNSSERKEGR